MQLRCTSRRSLSLCAIVTCLGLILNANSLADSLYSVTTGAVHQLNPNTGALINTFMPPYPPQAAGGDGLAFSGTAIYYTTIDTPNIYLLNPVSGTVLSSFTGPVSGIDALGYGSSAFGSTLFALNYTANQLYRLNPATGALFSSSALGFDAIGGIDFSTARGTLFISDQSGVIRELNPDTGVVLNSFSTGAFQTGLGFVGARLFTSAQYSTTIVERNPVTGAVLNSFLSPGGFAGALAGSPVPEPSSMALIGVGFAVLIPALRRRAG